MDNILTAWLKEFRQELERNGFDVGDVQKWEGGSFSVDLEKPEFGGRVTHWPKDQFEFQLDSKTSGEVLIIDTLKSSCIDDLNAYFDQLWREKLQHISQ